MSRWRPPPENSSPYVTADGHARLKAEFEQLWRVRRPEVVRALSAAAAEGDRSENAEYQYRKKELREIDARLKYLTRRLEDVKIVEPKSSGDGKVYFGVWVELADDDGKTRRYRIVGADEADSGRSEEHTSELQSLMRNSYAVFCLKKKTTYTDIENS